MRRRELILWDARGERRMACYDVVGGHGQSHPFAGPPLVAEKPSHTLEPPYRHVIVNGNCSADVFVGMGQLSPHKPEPGGC